MALEEIYQTYANQVKKFLITLTANVDLAEELTQETFYQAIKSIHRFDGSCKISVWLCQIAKHRYYDYLKKEKHHLRTSLNSLDEVKEQESLPEKTILEKEQLELIRKEVGSLKEPYREIFLLRTSMDFSFREIGIIFEKSENWARVTYYRARMKLIERVEKHEL